MKIRLLIFVCSISMLLYGCDWFGNPPSFDDDFITYVIKPGNYEAENTQASFVLQKSDVMDFQAIFDESCKYTSADPGNQYDINKLMGFSDCGLHHHGSSARLGWNWNEGQLRIYTYVYSEGIRIPEILMGVAEIGKIHHYKIEIDGDQYRFTMDDHVEVVPRICDSKGILPSYQLFPYFGGDEPAPHEVRIKVRML